MPDINRITAKYFAIMPFSDDFSVFWNVMQDEIDKINGVRTSFNLHCIKYLAH